MVTMITINNINIIGIDDNLDKDYLEILIRDKFVVGRSDLGTSARHTPGNERKTSPEIHVQAHRCSGRRGAQDE